MWILRDFREPVTSVRVTSFHCSVALHHNVNASKVRISICRHQFCSCSTQVRANPQQPTLEGTNKILMRFCPEVNRKWDVSLWDLIELQMKVRGDRKGQELLPEQNSSTAIHPNLFLRHHKKNRIKKTLYVQYNINKQILYF